MFVLAHLSDPHLGPLPTPRLTELAGKRAAGFFNWRRKRHRIHRTEVLARVTADLKAQAVDHIAVTGDLVNISLAGEYAPARAWLASLGPPRDVTLVPGNHDAYVRAAAHYPQLHWGEYMRGDDAPETAFPFVRRRGPLALIGLSTAVPTAAFLATGRLGREQIEKLAEALERCGREALFRVVMIHHPPISKPSRHLKRLVDGAVYAGCEPSMIFKSSDGGSSWSAVNIGPSPDASREMAIDPQTLSTLYASTYTKLFKSSDGGSSWSSVGPVSTQTVAFDLQSPTTVYAGTDYALFKSIDGGASFSRTGLTVLGVYAVAVDPKVPTTLYAGTRDYSPNLTGVVKSTDGGASWSAANNGLGIQPLGRALAIDPLNPAIIYVGIAGRGVFKSTDGGMSWTGINTGLTNLSIYALAIDPMTPTILYAGTGAGVFVLEQQPNRAPLADAGPDQVVEATDAGGAVVTLDGSRSSDPDGDSLTFAWSWPSGTATGWR